jgi:hypothetical protein
MISETVGTARPARSIADWWCLVATPLFAIMAVLTAAFAKQMPMDGSSPVAFALGGMPLMYLLMSAAHAGPWLRLIAKRESTIR